MINEEQIFKLRILTRDVRVTWGIGPDGLWLTIDQKNYYHYANDYTGYIRILSTIAVLKAVQVVEGKINK